MRSSTSPTDASEQALARNSAALAAVREGLRLDYVQPPASVGDVPSPMPRMDKLANLLALEARVDRRRGEWGAAENAFLDQIAFAEGLMRGAGIAGEEMALANRGLAPAGPRDVSDHLTAAELRAASGRIESIIAHRVSFADVLMDEKWLQLRFRDDLLSNPDWRDMLAHNSGLGAGAQGRLAQLSGQVRWLTTDKRQIMLDYLQYMDSCIAVARSSPTSLPAYPRPPSDPINQSLAMDVASAHMALNAAASDDARIQLKIALRRYYLDHGSYPAGLAALCPTYLNALPADHQSGGWPYAYRRTNGSYTLTSTGAPQIRQSRFQMIRWR
jgi:hypothetical protein